MPLKKIVKIITFVFLNFLIYDELNKNEIKLYIYISIKI